MTQLNAVPARYLSTLPVRDTAENTAMSASVANPFAGLLPNWSNQNGTTTVLPNLLVPYPEFPAGTSSGGWSGSSGVIEQSLDLGHSYFHSLNVRLDRRLSQGLSAIVNYGYSRLIEQDTWLNATDPVPEKRVSPIDHPHRIVGVVTYDLPVGRGRALNIQSRWLDAIVGDWHVNSVYTWQLGALRSG